jgi:acyl-CoA synthetase (NDP forming)
MHPLIEAARHAGRAALTEADAKTLLGEFGIAVPRATTVTTPEQASDGRLDSMRAPFVAKVMSDDILHKSDAGGVQLGLDGAMEVSQAIESMLDRLPRGEAGIDGFLVEEMASAGVEVVIGAVRDPSFGPLLMVGLGGIFVEVLADVAFRICPLTRADAASALDELKGAALLDGVRGTAAVSRHAIVDIMLRLGGEDGLLLRQGEGIAEIDLNPVIVRADGAIAVDARIIVEQAAVPVARALAPDDGLSVTERFEALFAPRNIAVFGASSTRAPLANTFIRRMRDFGFAGAIYPVHPQAAEIEGLTAYPDIHAVPEPVDYAYFAMGAERIPPVLAGANGRIRFAHVISSGFGEVAEGRELETELIRAARAGGCRVLGPNCLGLYSPRGRVSFSVGAPEELGAVGIVSQSGGLSTDIIKRGQWRGLRFSALVSIGNSADLEPADLLEFLLADTHTEVIGLYLEDIKDGQRFFELLVGGRARKPVVILRGGRSQQGRIAAVSHTGALAGDGRAWDALARQTGCVMVDTIDAFIDVLLAFQQLTVRRERPTSRVVLFGNGGGTSVLATDSFAEVGLDVLPFEGEALARLEALGLPPGTSVVNPIDTPVGTLQERDGLVARTILDIVYDHAAPDAVVMHLNLAAFVGRGTVDPVDNLIQVVESVRSERTERCHLVLVLRTDGSPELEASKRAYRERATAAGIVVYDELINAARALAAVRDVEGFTA